MLSARLLLNQHFSPDSLQMTTPLRLSGVKQLFVLTWKDVMRIWIKRTSFNLLILMLLGCGEFKI
jgi:hypothetical protein